MTETKIKDSGGALVAVVEVMLKPWLETLIWRLKRGTLSGLFREHAMLRFCIGPYSRPMLMALTDDIYLSKSCEYLVSLIKSSTSSRTRAGRYKIQVAQKHMRAMQSASAAYALVH